MALASAIRSGLIEGPRLLVGLTTRDRGRWSIPPHGRIAHVCPVSHGSPRISGPDGRVAVPHRGHYPGGCHQVYADWNPRGPGRG